MTGIAKPNGDDAGERLEPEVPSLASQGANTYSPAASSRSARLNENETDQSLNARKSAVNNLRIRSLVSNDEGDVTNQAGASAETERRRVAGALRGFGGWGRGFGF